MNKKYLKAFILAGGLAMAGLSLGVNAENEYPSTAIGGITSEVEEYVSRLSDDELAATKADNNVTAKTVMNQSTSLYPDYAGKCMAIVDNSLNVREEPSSDGAIVGKMSTTAVADVVSYGEQWTEISSGNVTGYVATEFLVFNDDAGENAQSACTTVITVTADTLKVRADQTTNSLVVTTISNGSEYPVINEYDDWIEIQVDDSTTGFVWKEFVTTRFGTTTAMTLTEMKNEIRQKICNYALQFVGNPYVWGGTSLTNGTDCSGFTMRVYQHFGYSLQRTAMYQINDGVRVDLDELEPGDLLFYNHGSRIGHVAIYIGNGQVVHASTESTGIIVSSMYMSGLVGATRIIY